jgi:Amt family ammonium transporter
MEIAFALDTFYAVNGRCLVMFMAAGFTMLEAGLVQKKMYQKLLLKILVYIQ